MVSIHDIFFLTFLREYLSDLCFLYLVDYIVVLQDIRGILFYFLIFVSHGCRLFASCYYLI